MRRLKTPVDVLTSKKTPRNSGWFTLRLKRLPTKNRATVASEVALKMSRASMRWCESRLDSYRPKKENRECQSKSSPANSTKLRTEICMERNSASEKAPKLRRLATAATMSDPTRSATSENLKRLNRM